MKKGKLIIFAAPSGSGKTTLVRHLLTKENDLMFSVSATTRRGRANEIDGKHYYFLSLETFKQKLAQDEFLEYQEVYDGNFYGTLKSEIERIWSLGKHVIFDVDVKGAMNIKKFYGDAALAIFVRVPALHILEERLRSRASETEQSIRTRLAKAKEEIGYAKQFDFILLNDEINEAKRQAEAVVANFLASDAAPRPSLSFVEKEKKGVAALLGA